MPPKKTRSASKTFEFTKWCQSANLSVSTKKILKDNALHEEEALLFLKPSDVSALQEPMGQHVYLRNALAKMGSPAFQDKEQPANNEEINAIDDQRSDQQSPRPSQDNVTAMDKAEEALDALFSSKPAPYAEDPDTLVASQACGFAQEMDLHDPRMLLTVKASQRKAERIINFLPERVKERIQRRRRDRLVFSQAEDGAIMFKPSEVDTHAITPAEWGAANMRLLSHLLRKGDLAYKNVEFYLAYTVQIYELAEKFEWSSLMEFDTRYRELQAEHNFRWGDMRFASQIHLLTPRRQGPQQYGRRPQQQNKEECKKCLASGGKNCPFGTNCRYLHKKLNESTSKNEA